MSSVRELREKGTPAETMLWRELHASRIGFKFRRQVDIGPFVVDFCCFSKKLIIELDGEFHKELDRKARDISRTKYLRGLGYGVIRFWNDEIVNDIEVVLERIRKNLTLSEY